MESLMTGLTTTAVGIIVVFVGLTLLIGFIKAMNAIELRAEKRAEAKKPAEAAPQEASAAVAIEEPEAEETDDGELVAAISAAIAAVWQQEGGFIVRRVRRISQTPAWQKAARDEQIYSRM